MSQPQSGRSLLSPNGHLDVVSDFPPKRGIRHCVSLRVVEVCDRGPRGPGLSRCGESVVARSRRPPRPYALFWAHVLPYGEVKLNMPRRIAFNTAQTVETNAESS